MAAGISVQNTQLDTTTFHNAQLPDLPAPNVETVDFVSQGVSGLADGAMQAFDVAANALLGLAHIAFLVFATSKLIEAAFNSK